MKRAAESEVPHFILFYFILFLFFPPLRLPHSTFFFSSLVLRPSAAQCGLIICLAYVARQPLFHNQEAAEKKGEPATKKIQNWGRV